MSVNLPPNNPYNFPESMVFAYQRATDEPLSYSSALSELNEWYEDDPEEFMELFEEFMTDETPLRNSEVRPLRTDENLLRRIDEARLPRPANRFFRMLGRGIINVLHKISRLFKRNYPQIEPSSLERERIIPFMPLVAQPRRLFPREFSEEVIGRSLGIRGEIRVRPFSANSIFPHGGACLADIRQNPAYQNSWFLAALAAVLKSFGPEIVERLITLNDDGTYTVLLGRNEYTIPGGDITDARGNSFLSDSAPWVRILETACCARTIEDGPNTRRRPQEGHFVITNDPSFRIPSGSVRNQAREIEEALENNQTVILHHHAGFKNAVKDGIEENQVVAILDILTEELEDGRTEHKLCIFDPSAGVRVMDLDILERGRVYIA